MHNLSSSTFPLQRRTVFAIADNLPELRDLHLSFCNNITFRSIPVLMEKCFCLETLSLQGIRTLQYPTNILAELVVNFPTCRIIVD
jgi:hypothetical protein